VADGGGTAVLPDGQVPQPREDEAPLPLGAMVLVGTGLLAISTFAFFRVSLLPSIGDALSLSPSELGVLTTVFGIGRLAADVPVGRMTGTVVPARLFAASGIVMGAGGFLLAAAGGWPGAYGAAALLGIASSISNTTGMTFFSGGPAARRGRTLAIYSAALLVGQALGPMIGGLIAEVSSWRWAAAVAGGGGLTIAAMFVVQGRSIAAVALPPASIDDSEPLVIPPAERVVLYGVSFAMFFTLAAMPQTLVPIIGDRRLGLGAATIGLALGFGGACRLAGALGGGVLSDRVSRKAALIPGLAAVAAGAGLLAIRGGIWVWLAAIALMSIGSYGISVAATMMADRTSAQHVGRRFGEFRFVGDAGVIVGPVVAGVLFSHAGPTIAVLTVAAVPALTAVAGALVLTETVGLRR
jgi:MFS family permease